MDRVAAGTNSGGGNGVAVGSLLGNNTDGTSVGVLDGIAAGTNNDNGNGVVVGSCCNNGNCNGEDLDLAIIQMVHL